MMTFLQKLTDRVQSPEDNWPNQPPVFQKDHVPLLSKGASDAEVPQVSIDKIVENSKKFPLKIPVESVKCQNLQTKGVSYNDLERNINSVYPVLHECALPLFIQFLANKKMFGSEIERKFYQDFTVEQLVDRLLTKRAAMFCGGADKFLLLDGTRDCDSWEIIGTSNEKPPRVLENCLSYDEIKLSALLSVSSYTHFINDGARKNYGKYWTDRSGLEDSGIIIGLIGTRLRKPDVMEYQDIVVSENQNVQANGYGSFSVPTMRGIFINFYGEPCLTFEEARAQYGDRKKFTKLNEMTYFNNTIYERRLNISIDTLLLEANQRAKDANKMAYVYVVGIGLGVWRISNHQNDLFLDLCVKRLRFFGKSLSNVSDVCFAYIVEPSSPKYKEDFVPISGHPNGGIKIHFKNESPHLKLTGSHKGKLLVASYAWDGNALPGNEFWVKHLASSGDPAAACSTQVAELHNPHINPKVCGKNLKIATLTNGLQTFQNYIKTVKVV